MNFIEIIDRIFVNKNLYDQVSDKDKIDSFFKINRKLGKGYPEIAKKFNNYHIDKASAIDIWRDFFKDSYGIPAWYWDKKKDNKVEIKKSKKDYSLIQIRYEFKDFEIEYLKKYFKEDLDKKMKDLNKFEN